MGLHAATPVKFAPLKYGMALAVDSSSIPHWTGIVPDGEPHLLDFYEFLVVRSGAARIALNGTTTVVKGPAVFFTPPRTVRSVEVIDPMQLDLVVCSSRASIGGGWCAALRGLETGSLKVNDREVLPSLAGFARSMQDELRTPRFDSSLLLDALLTQFLIALKRSTGADANASCPPLVGRFEALLEQSFRRHHDVAHYAAALDVTADHLSAVTRTHRGIPAKALIDRRIFRDAAQLLGQSDASVTEISNVLGFDEPSCFTRFVIRVCGVPPSTYRKRANPGIRQLHSGN